jgi:hypothetical protein
LKKGSLASLDLGMSRATLEDDAGVKGQHQFRVKHDNSVYECASFAFVSRFNQYYFLFRDGSLASIHRMGDFYKSHIIIKDGKRLSVQIPWNTSDRIEEVLDASGLTIDDFQKDLEEYAASKNSRRSPSLNLWPIAIAMAPYYPVAAAGKSKQNMKERRWMEEFDPGDVLLGGTESDAVESFGKPTFKMKTDTGTLLSFGPDETFWKRDSEKAQLRDGVERFWVSVEIEKDKIVGVYSDGFFNREEIMHYEHLVDE